IRFDYPEDRVKDAAWHSDDPRNNPGFIYDVDRMAGYYTPNDRFKFGFGKDRYNWGPLELGGLLLSDYNEGFVGFYQQYKLGPFVLRGLTTQLNSVNINGSVAQRYYSASRLEWHKPSYGAAVGQAMLYWGIGRSFEMPYFIPFYIFHYAQMSENRGYNNSGQESKGSIDGYYKIYKLPVEVYGQLLIDDFQGHSDSVSQSHQNTTAWMMGFRLKDAGLWYGFIEGGKFSSFIYNHKDSPKRYLLNDNFIGSPLGPDQELLWGKIGRKFYGEILAADLNFWMRRSGERNINYPITSMLGTKNDPQPYGIIENESSFWGAVSCRKYNAELELSGGATMYKNRFNEKSDWKSYPFFGLYVTSGISVRAAND
ncbi:MAG: hypothetical protein LBB56_01455, partial [Chitinispirillales bacterium]|nr:hypothetical protein [Chitinispirillales bacterium]